MKNYLELTGQDKKLSTNTESDGRYHSNWLNMMYPRLKLARNLLTDDGVIFISIDDNEVANLRKVCDEIFGEENFVAQFVWQKKTGSADANAISIITEYILVFARDNSNLSLNQNEDAHDIKRFKFSDEFLSERGPFYYDNLDRGTLGYHLSLDYGVETPDGNLTFPNGRISQFNDGWRWKWGKEKLEWGIKNGFVELQKSTSNESVWKVYYKIYLNVDNEGNKIKRSTPYKNLIQGILNTHASLETKDIFGSSGFFSNPKPINLVKKLSLIGLNSDDVILDFFSGSATTAHAVMQLNAEDGGNRKYICVQIPEPTPEESEARKAGYATIPEIGKERIRRAGKKILEEQKAKAEKEGLFTEEPKKLDTGFKVFKLDSSNINEWDSDPGNLETALNRSLFNIKTDRSEDDLLYEILIKYGIELTEKINRHTIDGKTVYEMGAGSLIVCLADSLSTAVADGIGKLYKEVSPEGVGGNGRVVFKESGFNGSDEVKTNTLLILKQHGITNVATV
ncbi:MAG: site-specific DNA-methyltransferase, partial [Sulfuricurvum sp.]